jgi:ubiquinone/menaquinone biosynthesis C-methylase UbiE
VGFCWRTLHEQELGEELDILAVDVAQSMVHETRRKLGTLDPLGNNTAGVRVARADATTLPAYYGPFDAVFFHNSLGQTFQVPLPSTSQ